jgi:hypothetical protein
VPQRGWTVRNLPGAAHDEQSWRARIEIHLRLLPPPTGACNGR